MSFIMAALLSLPFSRRRWSKAGLEVVLKLELSEEDLPRWLLLSDVEEELSLCLK